MAVAGGMIFSAGMVGAVGAPEADSRVVFSATVQDIIEGKKPYQDTLGRTDKFEKGTIYVGSFLGRLPHGTGRAFWPNKKSSEALIGKFENGMFVQGQFIDELEVAIGEFRVEKGKVIGEVAPVGNANNCRSSIPHYWSGSESFSGGWRAELVHDDATIKGLAKMLFVQDPSQLGKGRDCVHYPRRYRGLRFYRAWRIEHPVLWKRYKAQAEFMTTNLKQLEKQRPPVLPEVLVVKLPGGSEMPGGLDDRIGEKFLLSGTKPNLVLPILNQGFNERMANTEGLFGAACYLAEEANKIDQYTAPDYKYNDAGLEDLHLRLYGRRARHPNHQKEGEEQDLFYCFVVRASLGMHVATVDGSTNKEDGKDVWSSASKRELAEIPGSSPPLRYHALVAEAGAGAWLQRFREFMVYNGSQCYIEYLVAYQRIS